MLMKLPSPLRRAVWIAKSLPKRMRRGDGFPPRLHLGCGPLRAAGWCNVDVTNRASVDVIDNILTLDKFKDNFASEIYACHVLEHLAHNEVPPTLARWFAVLKPGGTLRISVPDLDRIVKIYGANTKHFQTPGNSPWIGLIYGGQNDKHDFHKTGFNFCWMKKLLEDADFTGVEEYPHEPHFIPEMRDASLAKEPFGEFLSLNVLARKPGP